MKLKRGYSVRPGSRPAPLTTRAHMHGKLDRLGIRGQHYAALQQWDAALEMFAESLRLDPNQANVQSAYATCCMQLGRIEESLAHYRKALAINPQLLSARNNLIFLTDHAEGTTLEEMLAQRRAWWRIHGLPLAARRRRDFSHLDRDPGRPLRVAYVTADARAHSAAYCWGPVVLRHTGDPIRATIYSSTAKKDWDRVTDHFQQHCEFVDVEGWTDEALAERIAEDRIDIAVDLGGYSHTTRLRAFCLTPAPIQITAWGFATTTGLPIMDYFFCDDITLPASWVGRIVEEPWQLPNIVPFDLTGETPKEVGPLPASTAGDYRISFCSFSRPTKLSTMAFDLWAAVLNAVPTSRLLIKEHLYRYEYVRQLVTREFRARGVEPARIEFWGDTTHGRHLAAYQQADLALDPYPHGGGITTIEAASMGVPTVTLMGERIVSRLSASTNTRLGIAEGFVARTPEEYVRLAVAWAQPSATTMLADLRGRLRGLLKTSALAGEGYATAVEAAYKGMWQRWLKKTEGT
jgi:predicted O-linked N-acetylglucosamine transferase (SPINDLY family)